MKEFNAEEALKGAPVKTRNGSKAYIDEYDASSAFPYRGHVEGSDKRRSWTDRGTQYIELGESPNDLVAMWEDNTSDEGNIFEKALKEKLPLRYTILDDNIRDFYCIAKTLDGDYILEREDMGQTYVTKLSAFVKDLEWYIVGPKLPKAFKPNEGEEFWFLHPTTDTTVIKSKYSYNDVFYRGLVKIGLAFKSQEDAESALRFLQHNIEANRGKEQK